MSAGEREPRITVACHNCGSGVTITVNWHRRRNGREAYCAICKKLANVNADEDALWFWLEMYGEQRNGHTAVEHVAMYGLPVGLRDLIGTMTGGRLST